MADHAFLRVTPIEPCFPSWLKDNLNEVLGDVHLAGGVPSPVYEDPFEKFIDWGSDDEDEQTKEQTSQSSDVDTNGGASMATDQHANGSDTASKNGSVAQAGDGQGETPSLTYPAETSSNVAIADEIPDDASDATIDDPAMLEAMLEADSDGETPFLTYPDNQCSPSVAVPVGDSHGETPDLTYPDSQRSSSVPLPNGDNPGETPVLTYPDNQRSSSVPTPDSDSHGETPVLTYPDSQSSTSVAMNSDSHGETPSLTYPDSQRSSLVATVDGDSPGETPSLTYPDSQLSGSVTASDGAIDSGYASQQALIHQDAFWDFSMDLDQPDFSPPTSDHFDEDQAWQTITSAGIDPNAVATSSSASSGTAAVGNFDGLKETAAGLARASAEPVMDPASGLQALLAQVVAQEDQRAQLLSQVLANPGGNHEHPVAQKFAAAFAALDEYGRNVQDQASHPVGVPAPALPKGAKAARKPQGVQKRQGRVGGKAKPEAGKGENGFKAAETERLRAYLENYAREKNQTWDETVERVWAPGTESSDLWDGMQAVLAHRDRQAIVRHCRRQFHPYGKRGVWTSAEDEELSAAVARNGHKWVAIGREINRHPDDARDRYRNYLATPDNNKGRWSKEDVELFESCLAAVEAEARQAYREKTGRSDVDVPRKQFLNAEAIAKRMGYARGRIQVAYRLRRMALK